MGAANAKKRADRAAKTQLLSADQVFELEKLRLEAKSPKVTLGRIAAEGSTAVDTTDAEGRAKLLAAMPWIVGGIGVAVVAFMLLRKRRS